jgi:hypothetical protein
VYGERGGIDLRFLNFGSRLSICSFTLRHLGGDLKAGLVAVVERCSVQYHSHCIDSGVHNNFFQGCGGVYARNFFSGGGVQQIQLIGRGENGDLGAVAPLVRGSAQFANE